LVSFELARQLCRLGLPAPVHMFVSGGRSPSISSPNPPYHQLPNAEFMVELRRLNGTPEAVLQNAELMQLFLPILRADFAIMETYSYTIEELLDAPISAFCGRKDNEVSCDEVSAWREQTRGRFELHVLPGDHFFLHSTVLPQILQIVAQSLLPLQKKESL